MLLKLTSKLMKLYFPQMPVLGVFIFGKCWENILICLIL